MAQRRNSICASVQDDREMIVALTSWYDRNVLSSSASGKAFDIVRVDPVDDSISAAISPQLASRITGLLVQRSFVTASDLASMPRLKVIVRTGVGYDRVDREACAARGITLHNTPDYGTTEIADHAIALALGLRRGIFLQHDYQRVPGATWESQAGPSIEALEQGGAQRLAGPLVQRPQTRVWGAIGLGRIGTAAALRAKAFGWKVIFYDPYVANGYDKAIGVTRVRTIEELVSTADTISIHCPLTHETHGLVNDKLLSLVRPGAVLVNTARGPIVQLDAVERALRSGRMAGVGLDVVETEPITEPVPGLVREYRAREAWLMGRLVITPHVAYYSAEALHEIRVKSVETMRDVLLDGLVERNRI